MSCTTDFTTLLYSRFLLGVIFCQIMQERFSLSSLPAFTSKQRPRLDSVSEKLYSWIYPIGKFMDTLLKSCVISIQSRIIKKCDVPEENTSSQCLFTPQLSISDHRLNGLEVNILVKIGKQTFWLTLESKHWQTLKSKHFGKHWKPNIGKH